jgi:hypothetical protein
MVGRKRIIIDWAVVKEMFEAQCRVPEVAKALGISEESLYRRAQEDLNTTITELYQQCTASGQQNLKLKMYQVAMSGNVPMLIFLGKNYLGMTNDDAPRTLEIPHVEIIEKTTEDGDDNTE